MIDVIMSKKYELLEFTPFIEYIKQLEQENFELLSDNEEYGWRELIFSNEKEFLEILIFTDLEKECISIYKFKEKHYNYSQTEFHFYTKKGEKFYKPKCNRVIKFAEYFIEEEYAKLITSGFEYQDNEYIISTGWRHKRKIEKEELNKIIISGMNLQELTMRTEKQNLEFYECIDEEKGEVRKLKLSYDE